MKTRPIWRARSLIVILAGVATIGLGVGGCAAKRPVLYPNTHYKAVGRQAANADIRRCIEIAERAGHGGGEGGRIAKQAGQGAAIGAAAGGGAGLVTGNAGRKAAAGAAAGAAVGVVRGTINSGDPDPLHRSFVNKCLRNLGYDVIGWK